MASPLVERKQCSEVQPAIFRPIIQELTLAALLRILGEALHGLHRYLCAQALEALQSLPIRQQSTGFAQDLAARCHFEMAEYRQSADAYARCCEAHKLHRPLGLEYYSTALWHLHESVELSCLAQRVLTWDKLRPEVWCVVGNCFSLQREHDQAIRCFKRAVQLDSTFAYAYSLIAHELYASDKFDKAIHMYERAIAIDPHHYNAWWGLGNMYLQQEEHQKAKYHFQRAVEINTENAVLQTSLGMACQSLGQPERALELLSDAARSGQCSALASFQKGCVLSSLGRSAEAIAELLRAEQFAPREPCVHFQLGRAYAISGDAKKALLSFTTAMDLCGAKDSKDHQIIVNAQAELLKATSGVRADDEYTIEITPRPPVRRRRRTLQL